MAQVSSPEGKGGLTHRRTAPTATSATANERSAPGGGGEGGGRMEERFLHAHLEELGGAAPSSSSYSTKATSDRGPVCRGAAGDRMDFRAATLNCWAIQFIWPLGSPHRRLRLERLADALLKERYDIVGLQELWSSRDFAELAERVKDAYPFGHYFHSGFTGSGVAVLSKHPIVSTLMHRYSLNGFAHHIHRGDWFGGKVVGMVELEVGEVRILFYSTHLHAEYNRLNDLYLPHRIAQSFELSQFVRHTSRGADVVILTGDFNMEPEDLGYRLILANTQMIDAWKLAQGPTPDAETLAAGMTSDRPDNCYTMPSLIEKLGDGKRLDYIFFKRGRLCAELLSSDVTFNRIPGEDINFSDHIGVQAHFAIDATDRQMSTTWEHNRPLLHESLRILEKGEQRANWDRKLFLGLFALSLVLIVGSLITDHYFALLAPYFAVARFFLALFIAFCLWYGLIGLTMEQKALLAAKLSMEKLLND